LIWVYYSSQIVLLGAEFTHCYASRYRARALASHAPPEGLSRPRLDKSAA